MREIKFRIFSAGAMHFGGFSIHATAGKVNADMPFIDEDGPVMQFTGLLDKNGVEIYEGDVLDLHSTVNGVNLFSVFYDGDEARFSIRYHTDRMPHRSLGYEYSVSSFFEPCQFSGEVDYEVVGNVHQNPELLEET